MTLKYTLIIEGTEKEINEIKHCNPVWEATARYCTYGLVRYTPSIAYEVVEPLRVEYAATINSHGLINLITPDHRLIAHAGKKVKVVITEETE
jgi:hypothetical protein